MREAYAKATALGRVSTDWKAFDVPAMWSMLEDFDTGPQRTHVDGWRKVFDLTQQHLHRLRSYRDELVAAWPPEKSEASRRYIAELDKLIESVQSVDTAASDNNSAMSAATGAIEEARRRLKPIYERWQAHESTMADYQAKAAVTQPGRPAPMPGPSPLSPQWREDLNKEARAVIVARLSA